MPSDLNSGDEKNEKKRVVIIVGTRPQIIKSAPLLKALKKSRFFDCSIINTGQHYDYEMNRRFFKELDLPEPEINFEVGQEQASANDLVGRIILILGRYFNEYRPDLAIVPGDTNSALAAGIACSKLGVKIAHLEAGCRSNDFRMSEEVNRRVLDHMSHVLLCPTSLCRKNLVDEKVMGDVIENVGDTMLDSLLQFSPRIEESEATSEHKVEVGSYAFMTLHRAENVDDRHRLASILRWIDSLDFPVLFAVHPRTRRRIEQFGLEIPSNVDPIVPLPYFDNLRLVKDSSFVITDSGGVQKEAYWLQRPSMVLRDTTEWKEIVNVGGSVLVDCESLASFRDGFDRIKQINLLKTQNKVLGPNQFGDGHAADRVVDVLMRWFFPSVTAPLQTVTNDDGYQLEDSLASDGAGR